MPWLFEGNRGNDLRQRLASRDETDFWPRWQNAWLAGFAGKQKLQLMVDAPGRNGRNLDMQVVIDTTDIGVEVGLPDREPPTERFWSGDDADKISQRWMQQTNSSETISPTSLSLSQVFPRCRMFSQRHDLVKAAFGQSRITWQVNTETGESSEADVKFFPYGRFLNTTTPKGAPLSGVVLPGHLRGSPLFVLKRP